MNAPSSIARCSFSAYLRVLALAAAALAAVPAQAAVVAVDLAGFQSGGAIGSPSNSEVFLSIAPGAFITGWDFENLTIRTSNGSFLNEFVISVNNADGSSYMDAIPSDTDGEGSFGPASGAWGSALGGSDGAAFGVADGKVWVTVYELFVDAGVNATVVAGTLRINFDNPTAVPEPGTYALVGLGLLGMAATARRAKAR